MRDPFGGDLDPFRRFLAAGMPAAAPPARFPALPPEEAAPLKQDLLGRTVSGLHWVGSTLDKAFGGRAVRGVLGGKPREALSAIPFSDTIGFSDPEDTVTGAQLLKHWGYDPARGNWAERNLAGPALEVALDPGTYLSFGGKGAATALGKVLQRGGHVPGWSHKALIEGFAHTAPELRAAGASDAAIAHLVDRGTRVASDDVVKAAAAAGFGPDLAGKPLAGLAGVGLPFRANAFTLGHGPAAEAVAGTFDAARDALKFAPGVRQLRAVFDTRAGRQGHPGAQRAYEAGAVPAREAVEAATRGSEFDLRRRFDAALAATGGLPGVEPEALKVIRGLAEGAPQYADAMRWSADFGRRHAAGITPGVADPAAVEAAVRGQYPALGAIADAVREHGKKTYDEAVALGLPLEELGDDWVDYALRRYIAATPGFQGKDEAKFLPTTSGSNLRRSQRLRDIPGGTEQLNEWAMDRTLVGAGRLPDDQVKARVLADLTRTVLLDHPSGVLSPQEVQSLAGKAGSINEWLKEVPEGHVAGPAPIPFFSPDVIGDLVARGHRHAGTTGAAKALYAGIGGMARPIGEFAHPGERVPVYDFLVRQSGLRRTPDLATPLAAGDEAAIAGAGFRDVEHARDVARQVQATAAGAVPPVSAAELAGYQALGPLGDRLTRTLYAPSVHAYRALAPKGLGDVEDVYRGAVDPNAVLQQWGLATGDAHALAGMLQGFVTPTELSPFLDWMRSSQNFFKNMVYPVWPASHVRNAATAFYNNFLHGTGLGDYADAVRIMQGGGVADPARYAPTATLRRGQAAEVLQRLAYAHGKVFGGIGSFNERVGARGLDDELLAAGLLGDRRLTPHAPGHGPHPSLGEMARMPGAFNPLHQQGVGGGPLHQAVNRVFRGGAEARPFAEDRFLPLRVGRRVGTQVEDLARLAGFLGGVRQGMSPERAGLLTRAIHFDYTDLTEAERKVLKNVIPFYTFLRKNLPYQLGMAFERPSAVSPVLHAIGDASGGEWVPEYLAGGTAIPVGSERDGTRSYLTSLGLPQEEAFGRLKFKNVDLPGIGQRNVPSLGGTALAYAASLNPLLKALPEWASDTQFHTGRRLSDLSTAGPASLWGRLPEEYAQPLAQVLANSPLARFVTTGRTLADTRKGIGAKGLNLLTGLRVSDVDVAQQRALAARRELERMLKVDPRLAEFTNFYPRRDAGPLPAPLVDRLRLFTTLKNESKAFMEQQRRAAAGP